MSGLSKYLLAGVLTLLAAAPISAGAEKPGPGIPAPQAEPRLLDAPGPSVPLPGEPEYRPGARLDLAQRVTVPGAAIRDDEAPVREEKPLIRTDNPPDIKFRKGVFHRYRPRDPTPSQPSPP